MSEVNFKAFTTDTIDRANAVATQDHVTLEARVAIKDLIQIVGTLIAARDDAGGMSSDLRMAKKKVEQVRADQRVAEAKVEKIKSSVAAMIDAIRTVSTETAQILKRHEATPTDADAQSAAKLKSATQKLAELISQISQM